MGMNPENYFHIFKIDGTYAKSFVKNGVMGYELKDKLVKQPYPKDISVFTMEGVPEARIQTDCMLNAICVDDIRNIIYAVAWKDGEHSLVKMKID